MKFSDFNYVYYRNPYAQIQNQQARYIQYPKFTGAHTTTPTNNFGNEDKSNNGKFDVSEVGKNFIKGIISPVTAAFEHPIATIGLVAGTIAACSILPVLGPALAIGFGAYSLYQVGKGTYDVVNNYSKGNYDAAEKSFNTVGEGTIGTILSMLGIRQAAKVAQEAKLMSELKTGTLTEAQKTDIATSVKDAGFLNNIKETLSLFTTKNGLKATGHQFKLSVLKERFNDIKRIIIDKWPRKEKELVVSKKQLNFQEKIRRFKESPEGQRRAAMSDSDIQAELETLYNEAFDRLGIPKEQRPNLKFETKSAEHGGSYEKDLHRITFNPESYRSGVMDIEDVIMHEATHCKEALIRAGIPQDRVDAIVRNDLLSRLKNGESEQIIKGGSFLGADMIEPPKMSQAMKEDFAQFAIDELYKKDNNLYKIFRDYDLQTSLRKNKSSSFNLAEYQKAEEAAAPILDKLRALMAKHPDFARQYSSEQEAIEALMGYAQSHNFRYQVFTDVKINKNEKLLIKPTNEEELAHAEQSLADYITTLEGNGRTSGLKIFGPSEAEFNQYQFSPEEVLAQKNGNSYLIEKMTAKMKAMREAGTLSAADEAYLTKIIEKAKIVIEYKTKGLEYYKKYTELINNPNDNALKATVESMEKELAALKEKINADDIEKTTKIIKVLTMPEHATIDAPAVAIYNLINFLKD